MNTSETRDAGLKLATVAGLAAVAAVAQAADKKPAEDKRADSDPLKNNASDPRYEQFKSSPDPWVEVTKLEHGSDRSFASTLQTWILDADPAQYPTFEQKLLKVLTGAASTELSREWACRMLYYCGSDACVPAVAPLLGDEKTSHMARYALQPIAGSAVDEAFRAALSKTSGRTLAGLIGSIAARRDAAAVPALKTIADDAAAPADVREAAQRAVACIASH